MLKKFSILNGTIVDNVPSNNNIWVYINPDTQEKNFLINTLQIDESDIASALDPEEVPRLMFDPDYITLIWKQPRNVMGKQSPFFNVTSAGIFIKQDRLIFVLGEDLSLFEKRYPHKVESVFDVLFNFLYHSIHHYLGHLRVIKQISGEVQSKINTAMENEYLIQMFSLSESLVYYLNAISGNHAALLKLRNYCERTEQLKNKIELLDDVMIENNQCSKQAEIYSQVLSGLMDARGNLISNNMNVLIKNLTLINVIFLPLNLLASIGGMSEFSMMTHGVDWRISYSLFLIAMFALGWMTQVIINKFGIGVIFFLNKRDKKLES
ncbi:MAG: magnesium transporter CorA family protein [Candidatus Omnitrophota bacterium]|nr:magnesium transporter CorA family protein [Candidatus Omnitrophota bacterium]